MTDFPNATADSEMTALLNELLALQHENAQLKGQLTRLNEAVNRTAQAEMTWIYALEGNRDGGMGLERGDQ